MLRPLNRLLISNIALFLSILFIQSCLTRNTSKNTQEERTNKIRIFSSRNSLSAPPSSSWVRLENKDARDLNKIGYYNIVKKYPWIWEVFSGECDIRIRRKERQHRLRETPFSFNPKEFPSSFKPVSDIPFVFWSMGGDRVVLKLGHDIKRGCHIEWIIGFDGGEFGGSLWWASNDGTVFGHILSEQVKALYRVEGGVVVLTGIGQEGKVFLLRTRGVYGQPDVVNVDLVDGEPIRHFSQSDGTIIFTTYRGLWFIDSSGKIVSRVCDIDMVKGVVRGCIKEKGIGSFVIITTRGLWRIGGKESGSKVEEICSLNTDITYPVQVYTPIFQKSENEIYVGLLYYVIRLVIRDGLCNAEWFVPADCSKITKVDDICLCSEGRLSGKACEEL